MKTFGRPLSIMLSIVLAIFIFSPLAGAQSRNYDMYPQPVKEVLTSLDNATYYFNLLSSDPSKVYKVAEELGKLKKTH